MLNQKVSFSPKKTNLFGGSTNTEQFNSGLAWDSHKASEQIPDALVKSVEGNESMRRKFEMLCRSAQVTRSYGVVLIGIITYIISNKSRLTFAKLLKILTAKESSVQMLGQEKMEEEVFRKL
jgi:hypothetical protein